MNSEEIMYQQYRLYTEQKESFTERSFKTNRFYLILVLALILIAFITKGLTFPLGFTSTLVYGIAGMAICVMWWMNVDSYNLLIKIKFGKVIEEIEKSLPVKPYTDEFVGIKDYRKNKKMFLFSDIQKGLASLAFLLFLMLFLTEIIAFFPSTWF